uniref:Peptidase C1A papain C-terminal domain-containing protein n=2 Tax=Palpitomonas bilix TaxID=652834 RepID=A0A7S3D662_9EUKA|mmetsp:Transcript_23969/g.60692  ORF Transcript_23969/g.60692 Transcript_23969/m.60692 type:complete len:155 (+) Transcript_23969:156-620(+)
MMSARVRIGLLRQGKKVPKTPSIFDPMVAMLSPQHVVSCSQYSQGCDGGFEYLVAKYGQDFGIVSDHCFAYESGLRVQENTAVPCEYQCPESQRYFVHDYHYVGGYCGNSSVPQLMEELVTGGPISVGILCTPDFMHYQVSTSKHCEDASIEVA